jgi:hypothetical protein
MKQFRPWGTLDWLIPRLTTVSKWSFFGSLGTERRSLAAWEEFSRRKILANYLLLNIRDTYSRFSSLCEERISERRREFLAGGGNNNCVLEYDITAAHFQIVEAVESFAKHNCDNIVVDITSLPKRFFFPIIRLLRNNKFSAARNIVVTYSIPEKYTTEHLAENFGDWAQLPLFEGAYREQKVTNLVIGVGFEALGLLDRVETSEAGRRISFLLPFPAPVKAFQRSWELLRRLQEHQPPDSFSIHRVDVKDVSDAYDRLLSITNHGNVPVDLAPFGPKSMSLAMCLFATAFDCPAFYTQPTVYHPDYSTGIMTKDGIPEIYAYAIRIDGTDLYSV